MATKNLVEPVRVGAIGCGRIFGHAHLPAYLRLKNAYLVGFYDVNTKRAQFCLEKFREELSKKKGNNHSFPEPKVFQSAEELIGAVDVVDICTPPKWHISYALEALRKGVHAMVEKPMARSWWEAEQLREEVKRGKALFQLNDDNVTLTRYKLLKNIISSGEIGRPISIWLMRGSRMHKTNLYWHYDWDITGGGVVQDYGCHGVAGAWSLLGFDKYPDEVMSLKMALNYPYQIVNGIWQRVAVEDDAHIQITFKDKKDNSTSYVILEATWSDHEFGDDGGDQSGYIEIRGSNGSRIVGRVDPETGRSYLEIQKPRYGNKLVELPEEKSEGPSFEREIQNFISCIQHSQKSFLNEEVGTQIMAILDAAYLSNVEKRAITINELKKYVSDFRKQYEDDTTANKEWKRMLMKPFSE